MPPVIVEERWDSRNGSDSVDNPSKELIYVVAYAADENEAMQVADSEAPLEMTFPSGRTVVKQTLDWEIGDGDLYHVTVHYGKLKPKEPGEFDFTFDTTGKTEKRTQSLKTKGQYVPSGTPCDFKGAIGVTDDAVEGVENTIPGFKWTETHYLPLEACTMQYALVLRALTGKRNSAPFRVFGKGEVLFNGAQGGKKDEKTGAITFNFEAGVHATDLKVGDITGIAKEAWDYLWVRYRESEDTAAKAKIKKPIQVNVEEVTYEADFSLLGIGVT